jgi:ferredoxin
MAVIHPDECINCGACETECPVEAIYEDNAIPEDLHKWVAINASFTRSLTSKQKERLRRLASDGQL